MARTKQEALAILFAAADAYQEHLVDRKLLFLCQDKHRHAYCVEAAFSGGNFRQLTGLETALSPTHFFHLCLDRRLKLSDFELPKNGMADCKLKVLQRVCQKDLSATRIGAYTHSQRLLSIGRGAGSVPACMELVGHDPDGLYVPRILLGGDIRRFVSVPDRIIATYRKRNTETVYSEIVYRAKKIDASGFSLPPAYAS